MYTAFSKISIRCIILLPKCESVITRGGVQGGANCNNSQMSNKEGVFCIHVDCRAMHMHATALVFNMLLYSNVYNFHHR